MASASVEQEFDLSADALWALVGDFGNVGQWSGEPPEHCVQEGEGIGCLRRRTVDEGAVMVERLEARSEHSYTYSLVDPVSSPLPFRAYIATIMVLPIDGQRSRLIWAGEFEPDGITEEQATSLALSVWALDIGLMRQTVAALSE